MGKTSKHASPEPPTMTAATMPGNYVVESIVCIPTLGDRLRKAHDLATLALAGITLNCIEERRVAAAEKVVYEATGSLLHTRPMVVAAGRLLNQALEELYWILHHPEPAVLEMRVPTDEDWEHYQKEQREAGAR